MHEYQLRYLELHDTVSIGDGLIPDVSCALRRCGVLVGCVEVKPPPEVRKNCTEPPAVDPKHFGQVCGYLQHMRCDLGVNDPIAILTTYNEWRVCWLPESSALAEADIPPHLDRELENNTSPPMVQFEPSRPPTRDNVLKGIDLELPKEKEKTDDGESKTSTQTTKKHVKKADTLPVGPAPSDTTNSSSSATSFHPSAFSSASGSYSSGSSALPAMYCSEPVLWNDPNIAVFLFSALFKMGCSTIRKFDLGDAKTRDFTILSADHLKWRGDFFTAGTKKLDFLTPPTVASAFALLRHIGRGGDGSVWLASDNRGHVCVLKLTTEEKIQKEIVGWNIFLKAHNCRWPVQRVEFRNATLWGPDVANTTPITGVMMPYVDTSVCDWAADKVEAAMRSAISILASAGYKHGDLQLRHLGLWVVPPVSAEPTAADVLVTVPVLFDLSRLEKMDRKEAESQMIEEFEVGCWLVCCFGAADLIISVAHSSSSVLDFAQRLLKPNAAAPAE